KVARALPDQPRPSRGSGRRARDGRMPRLPLVAVSKYTEIVASGNCFSELLGMGWFVACAVEAGRCRRRRASSAAVGPVAILWYAAGWYGGRAGPYGGTCDVLGAFRPGRARGGCGAGPRGRPWRPDAPCHWVGRSRAVAAGVWCGRYVRRTGGGGGGGPARRAAARAARRLGRRPGHAARQSPRPRPAG